MPDNQDYPISLKSVHALSAAKAATRDPAVKAILDLVERRYEEVHTHCRTVAPGVAHDLSAMCIEASKYVNRLLQELGHDAKLLEGEVPIGPQSWLEHHVSLVRLASAFIVIDCTVRQMERFGGAAFLVLLTEPSFEALTAQLKVEYDWWVPDQPAVVRPASPRKNDVVGRSRSDRNLR